MKIREFVLRLAALYNFPITIFDEKTNSSIDHPAILGAEKWIDDNFIDGNRLQMFYNYVVINFIPTNVVRYPTPGNLEKIFKEYNLIKNNLKPFSQIEYTPLTKKEINENEKRRIKFFKECPEKYLNMDINEIKKIAETMSFDKQLDEFGFNLFGELHSEGVYSRHGQWVSRQKKIDKAEVMRAF